MKMLKLLASLMIITGLMVVSGCKSNDGEGKDTIPPTADDPLEGDIGEEVVVETLKENEWGEAGQSMVRDSSLWKRIPNLKFPTIYFAYDQSRIGTSEQSKLEKVAEYMLKHPGIGLFIEGHCDDRGSQEYNRSLGERRAIAVKDYLVNLGVNEARFKTVSYGEERPAVEGSTPDVWTKNRRAELVPARM